MSNSNPNDRWPAGTLEFQHYTRTLNERLDRVLAKIDQRAAAALESDAIDLVVCVHQ